MAPTDKSIPEYPEMMTNISASASRAIGTSD